MIIEGQGEGEFTIPEAVISNELIEQFEKTLVFTGSAPQEMFGERKAEAGDAEADQKKNIF